MRKYPLINLNCRWRFRPASIQPLAYRAVLYREIPLRMKKNVPTDTSKFAAEILNAALKMSLEWGENWLAPIHQRIQKAYPKLSAEEADSLNLWCIEVRKYAFALVEEEYPLALVNSVSRPRQLNRSASLLRDATENMLDIYSLVEGTTYIIEKDFNDFYNQPFTRGEKLTFVEKHFLPHDGGHTIVFKQRRLYLQEEEHKSIIDNFDAYFARQN